MYPLLRLLLFSLDPETAHRLSLLLLRLAGRLPPARHWLAAAFAPPSKPVRAFGLAFKNPVGLAAGYDKDAAAVQGLAALGFGHIEVGTVTPRTQPGNPRPRLYRLVEDEAVINRMGFPGRGIQAVAQSLQAARQGRRNLEAVIGVNLGKNSDTPLEEAAGDYLALMNTFTPLADYLAINVSSPNTVGLRRLQGRALLEDLLGAIARQRAHSRVVRPVLVKIAPDLTDEELDDAVGVILGCGMDGIIAGNPPRGREGLLSPLRAQAGGLSGRPLRGLSEAVLDKVIARVGGRVPVISAGGIMSAEDAKRRLDRGAALVQVYTGLVYRGPKLVREIGQAL
jgi:dihydroorotate dehydrogenase